MTSNQWHETGAFAVARLWMLLSNHSHLKLNSASAMIHPSLFKWLVIIAGFLPWSLIAQSEPTITLDDRINGIMEPITNVIMKVIFVEVSIGWGQAVPFVLIWLLAGAVFFTVYNKFVNVRAFGHALAVDGEGAVGVIVKGRHQAYQRAFAGAGGADKRDHLAGPGV